jgi:hypothetical protein
MIRRRTLNTIALPLLFASCSDERHALPRASSSAEVLDVLMNKAVPRTPDRASTRAHFEALVAPERWHQSLSFQFQGQDRSWPALFRKPPAPRVSPDESSDPKIAPVVDRVRGTAIVASWNREGPDWVIPVGALDRGFVLASDVCPLRMNRHASFTLGLFAHGSNPESRDVFVRFECRSSAEMESAHYEVGVYASAEGRAVLGRNSQETATEYLCGHWYRVLVHGEPDARQPGLTRIRARIAPRNEDALPVPLEIEESIPTMLLEGPMVLGCYRPGPEPAGGASYVCCAEIDNLFFGWNAEVVPDAAAARPAFESGTWTVASWPPPGP